MFTGIVEEIGRIERIDKNPRLTHLVVAVKKVNEDVNVGDSIALNGTCLTVVSFNSSSVTFEAMDETMERTTLKFRKAGDSVNLERALTLSSRLGGHIVTGHVDEVGRILSIADDGDAKVYRLSISGKNAPLVVEKGSVAIDGVSLTVVSSDSAGFSVSVLPYTRKESIIGGYTAGSLVNIETDVIGKYVSSLMNKNSNNEGLTLEKLIRSGFGG